MSDQTHEYGLKEPGHITYCTHCGEEKPAYKGQGGAFGLLNSIIRWTNKHTATCPKSPRRGR